MCSKNTSIPIQRKKVRISIQYLCKKYQLIFSRTILHLNLLLLYTTTVACFTNIFDTCIFYIMYHIVLNSDSVINFNYSIQTGKSLM